MSEGLPTASTPPIEMVHDLRPISLRELDEAASLQVRVDRKYVVDGDQLERLVEELAHRLAVLDIDGSRSFGYESTYFDTPSLDSYLGAAHRRRRRFKVRTRSYVDSSTTMLEVKTRGPRGATVKRRRRHRYDLRHELGREGEAFVADAIGRAHVAETLRPTLTTSYRRVTLIDLDEVARVTVDADLWCADRSGNAVGLADRYVLETKSSSSPSPTDRLLWAGGIRPERISKYGTGLAALHPELPSNKWHRTIGRHFT
ncbi:MAG: polyphosphate polymerase domain-containing protein [Ilumatobacter sp.]|uniref:polyphosphate polymerase domain-containing protein n=1 Tax=Ilumatobacter sp. TaxID=1967498 RepID=UPI00260DDB44|nr:polyphosphate polymerase domain-containing protein [Ilumatobacter sp.]MDJ0767559.1 polyphosphate polymerase domain-containing protein [Ilumatobacter sp.]